MARGSAATDGRFVYIAPADSTSFYQYECSTEKWTELPSCPYKNSRLAIIDSELTTVGERMELVIVLTDYSHYDRGNGLRCTLQ